MAVSVWANFSRKPGRSGLPVMVEDDIHLAALDGDGLTAVGMAGGVALRSRPSGAAPTRPGGARRPR